MENENYIYRYRSLANNYAFDELENDYFYCSELSKLNDPVENKFNLIFEGDEIDFRGLLKYYIFCLMETFVTIKVATDDDNEEIGFGLIKKIENGDRLFYGFQDIPLHKETFPEIVDIIFNKKKYNELAKKIAQISKDKPLNLNSVLLLFKIINIECLFCIMYIFENKGFGVFKPGFIDSEECNRRLNSKIDFSQIYLIFENLPKIENSDEFNIVIQSFLFDKIGNLLFSNENNKTIRLKNDILFSKFPEIFFNNLYKKCLGEKYVCCFSEDCESQLMWSHYANSDTGICFKYKVEKKDNYYNFPQCEVIIGGGCTKQQNGDFIEHYVKERRNIIINKIEYVDKLQEIDFFANIGAMSRHDVTQFFYDAKQNKYGEKVGMYSDENIKKYWDIADIVALKKLKEWAYEKEYRFLQHWQFLIDNKVYYDFSQLEGIILGEGISLENKCKIISIIKEKCKKQNRNEFDIYQRKWSFDENKMITVKIPI